MGRKTNLFINNPGHMIKMAAMPIYGKNPLKFFFSGTNGPISTKLGMKHRGLKFYNVFINYDLDLFYGKVNIGHQCIGMGKTFKMSFKVKVLQEMGSRTEY